MFATLIPMFDENMKVSALSLFTQKENQLLHPSFMGTGKLDGVGVIDGLEVIDSVGIENLSEDGAIFVKVNGISIFAEIEEQSHCPIDRIVLLMDHSVEPNEQTIARVKVLRAKGYRFAIKSLVVSDFEAYSELMKFIDYILLDYKKINIEKGKKYFSALYPNMKLVAINVEDMAAFEKLKASGGYSLYEGEFYRIPVTKGAKDVAPVKATYIQLMNAVNEPDYDLTKAAEIIGRDTALVLALLRMVNNMTVKGGITSVGHAAAMLGQKELKKWIDTAITEALCEDKPSELTRISLIGARFAEKMAVPFGMASQSQELFLMGLFSLLDIILDKPMKEALQMVKVSPRIEQALVEGKGEFAEVLHFIRAYEQADWSEVSRVMILKNIDMDLVYKEYLDTLNWYKNLYR